MWWARGVCNGVGNGVCKGEGTGHEGHLGAAASCRVPPQPHPRPPPFFNTQGCTAGTTSPPTGWR